MVQASWSCCIKFLKNGKVKCVALLTCVDKAPRCSLAELFWLVRERDLYNTWNVSRRSLDTNGVWRDQLKHIDEIKNREKSSRKKSKLWFDLDKVSTHLTPHQHAAKHHLQAIEEVLPDDNDHGTAVSPALAGADGFDARGGCREEGGCVRWWRGFVRWFNHNKAMHSITPFSLYSHI